MLEHIQLLPCDAVLFAYVFVRIYGMTLLIAKSAVRYSAPGFHHFIVRVVCDYFVREIGLHFRCVGAHSPNNWSDRSEHDPCISVAQAVAHTLWHTHFATL